MSVIAPSKDWFRSVIAEAQRREVEVYERAQREYAEGDANENPFANFDSDADIGVDRMQSILTFANKHWRGIRQWVRTGEEQRDDPRNRIMDLRLYLLFAYADIELKMKRQEEEDERRILYGTGEEPDPPLGTIVAPIILPTVPPDPPPVSPYAQFLQGSGVANDVCPECTGIGRHFITCDHYQDSKIP